jgi:GntR family transcriptional repressor for pyruvate dehydrogenase complex
MSGAGDVTAAIRKYVAQRALEPGDRLPPERDLARELGVSRPALREGTRRLVDAGLLRARQGSGTYVADVDADELLAVRLRLEPLAAELAATVKDARAHAELTALVAAMGDALDEPARFAELDLELHRVIARAAGNRVLLRVLADLDQLLRVSRARTAARAQTRRQALSDVTRLVEAIGAGEPARAGAAMTEHLLDVTDGAGGDQSDRDRGSPRWRAAQRRSGPAAG